MGVVVTPSQLNVHPVFAAGGAVEGVLVVVQQGRLAHLPLEGREKQDVGARGIHFVALPWVDSLVLH